MENNVRLIDANAADVERICCYYGDHCRIEDVQEWLDDQPTIDVNPVVHGKWEYKFGHTRSWSSTYHCTMTCSICKSHYIRFDGMQYKYCPNCGAKMRGG